MKCEQTQKWSHNVLIIFHFAVNAAAEYEMKQIWRKKPLTIFAEKKKIFLNIIFWLFN